MKQKLFVWVTNDINSINNPLIVKSKKELKEILGVDEE